MKKRKTMKGSKMGCHGLRARAQAAFSLVEVTMALGVTGFALVGILGALPVAMSNERQSVAQTRAASIASTLFASFRAQTFTAVRYVDNQFSDSDGWTPSGGTVAPLDLTKLNTPGTAAPVEFFAAITDVNEKNADLDPRRVHFYDAAALSAKGTSGGAYKIAMRFANQPPGMLRAGIANRVEFAISALDQPKNVYRFSSVIASRTQ